MENSKLKEFEYRGYRTNELAIVYKRKDTRSFLDWIEPIQERLGPRIGWEWNPKQITIMTWYLGAPPGHFLPEEYILAYSSLNLIK